MKEDGVSLTRIRAPQNDQVRILNFPVRTRPATQPEDCRQTGDTWGVSSAVAAVNVVTADDSSCEFLGKEIQLVRGLGAAEHSESLRTIFSNRTTKTLRGAVESLVPGGGSKIPVLPNHGHRKSTSIGINHLQPSISTEALARFFERKVTTAILSSGP